MKRKRRLYSALAATGFYALGGLWCWADQPAHTHSKRGLVQQVNGTQNTFHLAKRSGKPTGTFVWDANTRFVENGVSVSPGELKPGNHASVRYLSHKGQHIATEVILHSPSLATDNSQQTESDLLTGATTVTWTGG